MFSNMASPKALVLFGLTFGLTTAFPQGLAELLASQPDLSALGSSLPRCNAGEGDCPFAAALKKRITTSSAKTTTSTAKVTTSSTSKTTIVSASASVSASVVLTTTKVSTTVSTTKVTTSVSASTVSATVSASVSVSTATPFNASLQYVSNTGAHAFVAPGSGDLRGPCPGLNAMANHNYMPHNGVGSLNDFIVGCQNVFGMGADLATFLAIYGAVFDGNLTSYSIGGPVSQSVSVAVSSTTLLSSSSTLLSVAATSTTLVSSTATLLSSTTSTLSSTLGSTSATLLVTAGGLSRSHNNYEGDSSPVRGDLYEYGNNSVVLSQFSALYALGQANNNSIDMDVLGNFRAQRINQSIANNPYYYNGPFTGVVVQPAAYSFIFRFMANNSAAYPNGLLTGSTIMSFYAIKGSYPDFQYTPGYEAIPNNWYKRSPTNNYTIAALSVDIDNWANEYPQFLAIGGNTGSDNTFTGVSPSNLTGGAYNAQTIAASNGTLCMGVEWMLSQAPSLLTGIYSDVSSAVNVLSNAVGNATAGMNCPVINSGNATMLQQFPGYSKLNSTGAYANTVSY